jgi:hypothetical protein
MPIDICTVERLLVAKFPTTFRPTKLGMIATYGDVIKKEIGIRCTPRENNISGEKIRGSCARAAANYQDAGTWFYSGDESTADTGYGTA